MLLLGDWKATDFVFEDLRGLLWPLLALPKCCPDVCCPAEE